MLAGELINPLIKPLRLTDSVQKALDRMAEFRLKQLPVVNNNQLLGLISQDNLLDSADPRHLIKDTNTGLINYSIQENQHFYEVLKLIAEQQLNVVSVLNRDKTYLGMISTEGIIDKLAVLTAAKEPGSIVVLEISNRDNSLAHIAQIVESDHAEILSSSVRSFTDSTRMEVTIKLNRTDISSIISAFQRYNYTILGVFNDSRSDEDNSDRYNQLMNYLDL